MVVAKPRHCPVARCVRVPGVFGVQPGTLQAPLLSPDQWRLSQQVRYLPLAILTCTVIFLTSAPFLAQEVIRGEGDEMDMWEGRRWEREGRAEASALNF